MFSKETYVNRRAELKKLVKSGIIILFGNNESPANFPANGYYPFRQDSTFLYYFGPKRDGLVGVIDVDNDKELLIGNDIDIDDIVWYGSVDSVHDMAEHAGVKESAPMKQLQVICDNAMKEKRTIHFLPPYRHDTMIQIFDLLGIHPSKQREAASVELIKAVVKMRSTKEQQEIEEIERACAIGYKMHTTAMRVTKPGVTEKYVGGQVNGIANSYGAMVSFPTIFSQHGEIMHGNPSMAVLESGRLALCDCGGETMEHYCSDNTRTFPVNGKFTQRQLEIYSIVEDCHDLALKISKPGVKYFDVHMDVCRLMTDRLKELGLMMGDTEEAVRAGAHAMFLPHGLGHMMGMDVHDMEGLGQTYVGFDDETRPNLEQFGTNCLRMGRRLEEGFVVTDEPGIYFIPALIDEWRAKGLHKDFINYEKLETYKDFGGIRIEDDILITSDGCRFLGEERIPYHPKDVEDFMSKN
ncbi:MULTISPECIES: aminopeptidase P family protein [Prevotella]|jgi:Xaa-Pro aminopeptidase|uniref:Xaa-Pro aminopeptidase n=1 Tax=Prevotella pectinovora TaxID=1602169 RepID=A0A0D0IYR1_9BACT|nr:MULTISPECIES: aminopeptidase P family protein [Prevotella]KIP54465.1 Xaa-Pro aminopeptidase [Prevotella pectinovora]KIP56526.1 Xaa-Pro aminopeptidase [Prevotella pectinovora]KIP61704.1 Xaa-Pro aminopeptidase [Prevotella pectinovora]KIP61999.1 Xaa-Pro aminopeptidase [Prevotella pectinovora]KIP63128.1 Xaa-Pro aminopeptidase [Prevotella pectinovora]